MGFGERGEVGIGGEVGVEAVGEEFLDGLASLLELADHGVDILSRFLRGVAQRKILYSGMRSQAPFERRRIMAFQLGQHRTTVFRKTNRLKLEIQIFLLDSEHRAQVSI